tara:strand:- start:85 stop:246 length:162 start_codon:yes stop_codon:yes gene_type:complete
MNKRTASEMRKAIKAYLKEDKKKQRSRHHNLWMIQWLDGQDVPIPREVEEAIK